MPGPVMIPGLGATSRTTPGATSIRCPGLQRLGPHRQFWPTPVPGGLVPASGTGSATAWHPTPGQSGPEYRGSDGDVECRRPDDPSRRLGLRRHRSRRGPVNDGASSRHRLPSQRDRTGRPSNGAKQPTPARRGRRRPPRAAAGGAAATASTRAGRERAIGRCGPGSCPAACSASPA